MDRPQSPLARKDRTRKMSPEQRRSSRSSQSKASSSTTLAPPVARAGSHSYVSDYSNCHTPSTINNLSLVTDHCGMYYVKALEEAEEVICGYFFKPAPEHHRMNQKGLDKFDLIATEKRLNEMYHSFYEAGSYYHEHSKLPRTVLRQEGLQSHMNDAIVDSLFIAHHGLNQVEYDGASDLAKSLRPVLEDYRETYQGYLAHSINEDPHNDAWTETHTKNTLKHCRSINTLMSLFRTPSAFTAEESQRLHPPTKSSTGKKGKSTRLHQLMTDLGPSHLGDDWVPTPLSTHSSLSYKYPPSPTE